MRTSRRSETLLTTSLRDSDHTQPIESPPGPPSAQGPRSVLSERIGHTFVNPDLLDLALRHRSWCSENGGVESNERLEFLGDAVLGVVVTDHLFRRAPDRSEGVLARNRSELVSSTALARFARALDLGDSLQLGKGESATGGREKSSILADALEAVIGAVFLDAGLSAAEAVILRVVGQQLDTVLAGDLTTDYKSQLQELSARDFGEVPAYRIREEGPEHEKRFAAEVVVDGEVRGSGDGHTKKAAEQAAARRALKRLMAHSDQSTSDAFVVGHDRNEHEVEEDHA